MQYLAPFFRFSALCLVGVLVVAGTRELAAQATNAEIAAAKPSTPADLTQAELLKSYLQVREQLQAAQLAIVSSRLEAEAAAHAQTAAFNEKLDSLKSTLAVERERQQAEQQRQAAERERQEAELHRSNRTILIVASVFGGVGVMAMLFSTLFQWRAVSRLTEISSQRPALPAADSSGALLADATAAADHAVTLSNQRLLSTIERIERRIFELEHTAAHPAAPAATPTETVIMQSETEVPRRQSAEAEQAAHFNVLLGKGRAFLNSNRVQEAMDCYDEILKVDANHPEALIKKGAALERLKQDQEALRCYDRAIKADRNMTLAYLCKGGVYNRLARFDEAVACYEQALQVEEKRK
jgi:tetratricopeptide (TPR) repeat protein